VDNGWEKGYRDNGLYWEKGYRPRTLDFRVNLFGKPLV